MPESTAVTAQNERWLFLQPQKTQIWIKKKKKKKATTWDVYKTSETHTDVSTFSKWIKTHDCGRHQLVWLKKVPRSEDGGRSVREGGGVEEGGVV